MHCPKCAFLLPESAKFCPQCGTPVPVSVPANESTIGTGESPGDPRMQGQSVWPPGHVSAAPQPPTLPDSLAPLLRQGRAVASAPENRDYVIAAAGALLALVAFFFISYVSVNLSGLVIMAQPLNGPSLATGSSFPVSTDAGNVVGASGMLWLVPLCALAALAVAGLLAFKSRVVSALNAHSGALAFLVVGGVGALALVWFALSFKQQIDGFKGSDVVSLGYSFDLGFWLSLLGMLAVAFGGFRVRQSERHALPNAPAV